MYELWSPKETPREKARKKQSSLQRRTKTQLKQLLLSMGLFALVFFGQGFPDLRESNQRLLQAITGETDFSGAFLQFGKALSQEENFMGEVGVFCLSLFGGQQLLATSQEAEPASPQPFQPEEENPLPPGTEYFQQEEMLGVFGHEAQFFSLEREEPDTGPMLSYPLAGSGGIVTLPGVASSDSPQETMAVGTILASVEMPVLTVPLENPETQNSIFTLDLLYLGERAMVTPLYAMITSEFGLRQDPLSGEIDLHRGADIRGSEGTSMVAWSDGVVETVGETSIVGRYLRIDHGEEVRSFYAHCQDIFVTEGQVVSAGEVIASVGATGQVTGAHLHFEITWQDMFLDPLHYIEYEGIVVYED